MKKYHCMLCTYSIGLKGKKVSLAGSRSDQAEQVSNSRKEFHLTMCLVFTQSGYIKHHTKQSSYPVQDRIKVVLEVGAIQPSSTISSHMVPALGLGATHIGKLRWSALLQAHSCRSPSWSKTACCIVLIDKGEQNQSPPWRKAWKTGVCSFFGEWASSFHMCFKYRGLLYSAQTYLRRTQAGPGGTV